MPFKNLKRVHTVGVVCWLSYQGDETSSNHCLRYMGQDPAGFGMQTGIYLGDKVTTQIVPGYLMLTKITNPAPGRKPNAAMMIDNKDNTFRINTAFGRQVDSTIIRPMFGNRNARYDMPTTAVWRAGDGAEYVFITLPDVGRFEKLCDYSLDQAKPVFAAHAKRSLQDA